MGVLFYILFAVLLAVGFFNLLATLFRLPSAANQKAMRKASNRQKGKVSSIELWLTDLAHWFSKIVRLNEFKREHLAMDLKTANIQITPEEYTANAIVKAVVIGLLAILVWRVSKGASFIFLILAIYKYRKEINKVKEQIKKKREAIENELPRFVFTIQKIMLHSRNVLNIIEQFSTNTVPEFAQELAITAADMRSGSYEHALVRLEGRVGSPQLSDICRGLQSVLRGDETTDYWITLNHKFADIQRQRMKQKANKVPDKIKRLSFALMLCFVATFFTIVIIKITESLSLIF